MRQPLVWLGISFCSGIVAANYLEFPFIFFYLLACLFLIFSVIFLKTRIRFAVFILCTVFFLSAVQLRNSQTLPKFHIARVTPYKAEQVSLKGFVDSYPVASERKTTFVFRVENLLKDQSSFEVCGRVLVYIFRKEKFSYGEELILRGSLYQPPRFSISGRLDYKDYLSRQGIYSLLAVKKSIAVIHTGRNSGNPLKRFVFWLKGRANSIISKNLSTLSASMLNAMLLGERKGVPGFVDKSLLRTGTCHILAVSGLHVGIVAFISLLFLKTIRVSGRPCYAIMIGLLIGYALLTGARPSVVRAAIMAVVILAGYLIGREINIYNSLAFAALIILILNPNQLFNIGFQLSFVCVISIIWISPKIKSLFPLRLFDRYGARFLITAISISSAAWLGSLGLIAYYFKVFSPVTIIANLIITSILPLLIASGLILLIFGGLSSFLGYIFGLNCNFFIVGLLKINSFLANIPGAYFKIGSIPYGYIFCYYGLLLLAFRFLPYPFLDKAQ